MSKFTDLFLLFVIAILIASCAPAIIPEKIVLPEKTQFPTYAFSYTAKASETKGDLTLALIAPTFIFTGTPASSLSPSYGSWLLKKDISPEVEEYVNRLIQSYLSSLQADFEKVLIAHGFRTLGPFADKEKMTYPQREQSDLALEPKVIIELFDEVRTTEQPKSIEVVSKKETKSKRKAVTISEDEPPPFIYEQREKEIRPGVISGNLSVAARIELHLYEPLSWEKMWIKNVSPPSISKQQYSYKYNDLNGQRVVGEDERVRILAELLNNYYTQILDQVSIYFDPREIRPIYEKAKEVRTKKRF